ncbi:MAG: DNA methyltransferase [Thiomonas sp.]
MTFQKTSGFKTSTIATIGDHLLWYAKDADRVKVRKLYQKQPVIPGEGNARWVLLSDGSYRGVTAEEKRGEHPIPADARLYKPDNIQSQGASSEPQPFVFQGKTYSPGANSHWKANYPKGMERLAQANRIHVAKNSIQYIRYADDFPYEEIGNIWVDTQTGNFTDEKVYVVQTNVKVVERCLLLCTEPGDLVFDPTCGSGTTAYCAEQWGRRWITCDTSRVPLALARQRLLTATFPYFELKDPQTGPQGGFVYKRKQNRKGEEIGGLIPHITLQSIAKEEPPATEVLVDRPEVNEKVTRVTGPFVVEATITPTQVLEDEPTAAALPAASQPLHDAIGAADAAHGGRPLAVAESAARYGDPATHIERMTQVLRQSKTLRLPGNRELVLADIRRISDSDVLHAEGTDSEGKRFAVVFGPEDGAISSDVVFEAAREAYFLKFPHLYFFGFAIQAKARELLEDRAKLRVPCTYVTVTPDVAMSDLLKTSRASEIFSVTGLPDAVLRKTGKKNDDGAQLYEVELLGLDIFNPATMEQEAIEGQNMPAWMLDTDYDGLCFYATQVFFPKTAAWDSLQKSLKAEFDPSVWAHLAGTVSEPFALGPRHRVAVKVIDERGNELMRVLEAKA